MRTWLLVTSASAVASLFFAAACSVGSDCDFGLCSGPTTAADGSSGTDGSVGAVPVDPCVATPTDPKCVDDSTALFVSKTTGSTSGDGTKAKPVSSVGLALQRLDDKHRRIYVCEGTYDEDLGFTAAHNGVSIIGGVDCTWNAKADAKPVIGASATPAKSTGTTGLALVDVAIEAKDAKDGGSSIALFVSGGDVTLKGVRLVAGKGDNGAAGVLVPFTNFPSQADLKGGDAMDNAGGKEKKVTCPGGLVTVGGKGGDIGFGGETGLPGPSNAAPLATCMNGFGRDGIENPAGTVGASASLPGTIDAVGWKPQGGGGGQIGSPGQGGGGGAGSGGGGGGGGAGGCGGAAGTGGQGGGGSIGLASFGASVTVVTSSIIGSTAGNGGSGADGQAGQSVFGFHGNGGNAACQGGNGAPGAKGGAGGGGAGGSSVGILSKGGKVTVDDATKAAIQVGTPGKGGTDGTGSMSNVGVTGANDPILAL